MRSLGFEFKWSVQMPHAPPLREVMTEIIRQAASNIMPTVRELVPSKTGDTRSSLYWEITDEGGASIRSDLVYAAYVRFPGEPPSQLHDIPIALRAEIERRLVARSDEIGAAVLREIMAPLEVLNAG